MPRSPRSRWPRSPPWSLWRRRPSTCIRGPMRRSRRGARFAVLAQHDERLLCPIPPSKQPSPSSETASTTRDEPSRGAGRQQPFGARDDTPFAGVFIPLNGVNRRSAIRCELGKGRAASRWPSRDSKTGGPPRSPSSTTVRGARRPQPSEEPVVQQVGATGDAVGDVAVARARRLGRDAVEPGLLDRGHARQRRHRRIGHLAPTASGQRAELGDVAGLEEAPAGPRAISTSTPLPTRRRTSGACATSTQHAGQYLRQRPGGRRESG
jgi:hypothetical protein